MKKKDEGLRLTDAWNEIGRIDSIHGYVLDIEEMKHLIYDSYRYFYENRSEDFISRSDLPIYKCIGQFLKFEYYPDNMKPSGFHTLADFAAGVCVAIETGFSAGYLEDTILLGCYQEEGSPGFAHMEAHMSSFEVFDEEFEKRLEDFREQFDEYDDEEDSDE